MKIHWLECGGLTIIAEQQVSGWLTIITGLGESYKAPCTDEETAKNAGVEGAKAILRRLEIPIPECLTDPKWISSSLNAN